MHFVIAIGFSAFASAIAIIVFLALFWVYVYLALFTPLGFILIPLTIYCIYKLSTRA